MVATIRCSLLVALCLALSASSVPQSKPKDSDKVFVCYFGSWAVYRPDAGKYDVENIDPSLCTHLIYGFAGLGNGEIVSLDSWNDLPDNYGKGAFTRFTGLKKTYPELKTLLAIGGWNEGSQKYSDMASSAASRKTFIDSVVPFLQKYGFDGLDLDWEYPTQRGGNEQTDKENHATLLKEMKAEFDKSGLMLTIAVSAGVPTIDAAYDVPAISEVVDHIHVMAYDFHGGSFDTVTGINAPLYPRPEDTGTVHDFTDDVGLKHWIDLGAPKEKLVLGMPLYGRTFTLQSADDNGLGVPSTGPGQAGPYTREAGFLGYNEICTMINEGGWTSVTNEYYLAPYMYKDNQWISYDDATSLAVKTQYVIDMGIKGAMVWSVETDDFQGSCGGGVDPLLKAIRTALNLPPSPTGQPITSSPTQSPPTQGPTQSTPTRGPTQSTPTRGPTQSAPTHDPYVTGGPDKDVCPDNGYVRDLYDCSVYYECTPGSSKDTYVEFRCAEPTVFNMQSETCDWPANVHDCD